VSKGAEGGARGRPRQTSEISLANCRRLDRDSRIPLYYQLAATLYEQLELGNWPEGTRFATERELEEEFEVSRSVVTRALGLLVGDGAIERRRGKGTFIAARRVPVPMFGLISALLSAREGISIEVISAEEEDPDPAIIEFLSLDKSENRIARIAVVIHSQGRAVGLIDSHVPTSRVPWLLDMALSIEAGASVTTPSSPKLTRSEVLVEHTTFSEWSGPMLGAKANDPAFMSRLIQYGRGSPRAAEQALEFARLVRPSYSTQIIFTLRT
jgi:DNA-binding GntR family transcriptional regulator